MMQDRSDHSYFFGILSMGVEPCQQIRADLLGIGLVEHFMASAGIELHGHIPQSRLAELLGHLGHAGPHAAHGVLIAAKEIDR